MRRREQPRLVTTPEGDVKVCDRVFHRHGEPIGDFRKAWATACIAAALFHVERNDAGTSVILGYSYVFASRPAEGLSLLEQGLRDAKPLVTVWAQALWSV